MSTSRHGSVIMQPHCSHQGAHHQVWPMLPHPHHSRLAWQLSHCTHLKSPALFGGSGTPALIKVHMIGLGAIIKTVHLNRREAAGGLSINIKEQPLEPFLLFQTAQPPPCTQFGLQLCSRLPPWLSLRGVSLFRPPRLELTAREYHTAATLKHASF